MSKSSDVKDAARLLLDLGGKLMDLVKNQGFWDGLAVTLQKAVDKRDGGRLSDETRVQWRRYVQSIADQMDVRLVEDGAMFVCHFPDATQLPIGLPRHGKVREDARWVRRVMRHRLRHSDRGEN